MMLVIHGFLILGRAKEAAVETHDEELSQSLSTPALADGGADTTAESAATGGTTSEMETTEVVATATDAAQIKEMDVDDTTAAEDDKKKKKKKKKKAAEEEKKPTKGPSKGTLSKIKKLQASIEEEKLRREQEALAAQRAEEEREQARLDKVSMLTV